MKLKTRIALTLALSAVLCSASAFAQDAGVTTTAADAPAKPAHHHHQAHAQKVADAGKYDSCLKQKLAVAEYYCSIHPGACQGEKDGAAAECRGEARGERHTAETGDQ
jgi:hypothetical protein